MTSIHIFTNAIYKKSLIYKRRLKKLKQQKKKCSIEQINQMREEESSNNKWFKKFSVQNLLSE